MDIIEDLRKAIDKYETDNCKTQLFNFQIEEGGTVLNVGETFRFKVRVTNQSHLDMKKVVVKAIGTSYADVALSTGPFGRSKVSGAFNLDAHQKYDTGFFRGKCKKVTSGVKNIVTARINSWDASFDHLLKDHTGAGVAEAKLSKEINPD